MQRTPYPLSALVGQDEMKLALLLNAVSPRIAGVLVQGEKGTAKSTAVRALQALLPDITVVKNCPFGCDPDDRFHLCEACSQLLEQDKTLPTQQRPIRLVELPLGATEDRVLGTLDLERAIKDGTRQFEPGLLAAAHRGILYIDEVNLLPDHLVDALLDAATTGMNVVEREGISFVHPAQFLLIGTMNPEEGDLRPQLLDRFGLSVEVRGLKDPRMRMEVVKRRIAFESHPLTFYEQWLRAESELRAQIENARRLLPQVVVPDSILGLIAHICTELDVEGLRADITIYKAATALAALENRLLVTEQDVHRVATMALPHRMRRQPFEQSGLDPETLENLLNTYQPPEPAEQESTPSMPAPDEPSPHSASNVADESQDARPQEQFTDGDAHPTLDPPDQVIPPGTPTALATLTPKQPHPTLHALVKKGIVPALKAARSGLSLPQAQARGRIVGAKRPIGQPSSLALAPTLRVAALHQKRRQAEHGLQGHRLWLERWDLFEPVHQQKPGALILFAVDASGSMAARKRMAAAKGAVLSLLQKAYQKRDHVGLLQFRGARATLMLPPTSSTSRAIQSLAQLPTGGRTPLASGLRLALHTLQFARTRNNQQPILVLVTDGRANVADPDSTRSSARNPLEDALVAAHELRLAGIPALVIDTEEGPVRMGLARTLAEALDATYVELATLEAAPVTNAIRRALKRT
ncbi:MAG TPA: magnesium chelatase subunit D family protein [Ktedonobacteraceae bacterium]|nr:magnesium chelatase subunit D family protein [Ktedonobacteraceae bacterium]